uniref:Uncharacterized protein n=1 Tax=Anguilla anguilla TaxID=7936 RepID=A0A0E9SXK9_ANGAN
MVCVVPFLKNIRMTVTLHAKHRKTANCVPLKLCCYIDMEYINVFVCFKYMDRSEVCQYLLTALMILLMIYTLLMWCMSWFPRIQML